MEAYPFNTSQSPGHGYKLTWEHFLPQKQPRCLLQHSGSHGTRRAGAQDNGPVDPSQGPMPSVSQESQMTESEAIEFKRAREREGKSLFHFTLLRLPHASPLSVSGLSFSFDRETDRGISGEVSLGCPGMPLHQRFSSGLGCALLWTGPWGLGRSRGSALRTLTGCIVGKEEESSKRVAVTECDGCREWEGKGPVGTHWRSLTQTQRATGAVQESSLRGSNIKI